MKGRVLRATLALGSVLAVFAVGCAGTQPYARFAQAGSNYARALDGLLVAAGNAAVDATSEQLYSDAKLGSFTTTRYADLTAKDKDYLQALGRLRAHARLLARYFDLLNQLATTKAPEQAAQEMGSVADGLNTIGNQLRNSPLLKPQHRDALAGVARLTLRLAAQRALRSELQLRKDVLRRELKTQELLLQDVGTDIKHEIENEQQGREERLVLRPIQSSPLPDADQWIQTRREIVTAARDVEELQHASDAASKLGAAFEDLVEGRSTLEKVNGLVEDVGAFAEIVETLRGKKKGSSP